MAENISPRIEYEREDVICHTPFFLILRLSAKAKEILRIEK